MKVRFTLEKPTPLPIYRENPITFTTAFWNFIATFSLAPTTFHWNSSTTKFSSTTSLFKKISCGAVHFCAILVTLIWLVIRILNLSVTDYTNSKLVDIFHLIKTSSSVLKSVLFIKILWTRKAHLTDFVNWTLCHFNASTSYWKAMLLIAYMVLTCVVFWGIGDITEFIRQLVNLPTLGPTLGIIEKYYISWWFTPFRILVGISILANYTVLSSANLIFLAVVLTLHSVAYKFEVVLKCQRLHSKKYIEMGLLTYAKVKCIVTSANHFFGDLVFTIYLETLLYFAETTGVIVAKPQYQQTAMFSLYLALFVYIWFLACEFHRKVNSTTIEWISNCQADLNISMEDQLRLNSLSNENRDAQLGISCRFFTVTYSLMGSMLGLIVTYGIMVLQVRANTSV